MDELIRASAREVVGRLRRREVTPAELLAAARKRIAETDAAINALPTLCFERAEAAARNLPAEDDAPGWLGGLPIAIKDLTDVKGVRTTFGSPVFADNVSEASNILVERLEARGALVVAKSNTPEFGAGGNTFNPVFGTTSTPWNTALTSGGSSGGAAAALAAGQVWLAHGSDLGGSLRTPASFCGVVGLRPSPGRVANAPKRDLFNPLSVQGPMARNVGDVALMLDAMSGFDARDPISLPRPETSFLAAAEAPRPPRRVAFSADLGITPIDPEIAAICTAAVRRLEAERIAVEEAHPDLSDAYDIFQTLRAALFAINYAPLLESHREKLKPDFIWNIEKGLALDAGAIGRAERARTALYERVLAFFGTHDLLLCPAAIVPPFDAGTIWIDRIGEHAFETYMDWLTITFALTLAAVPVLVIPCGVTASGLPVGLQLVARPRAEHTLLSHGAFAEALFGMADKVPLDPRSP
jgi:amidase